MNKEDIHRHITVLVAFAVITLVMTYPLFLQLGSSIRDPGDPMFNAWILAWDVEQLTNGNFSGFFDANIFFPHQRTLAYSEHLFPQSLVAAVPLVASNNPVLAHNLVTLLSMLTSAFGMYLLAHYLTENAVAGVVAGIVYGFSPFMFDHLVHVQLLAAGGIPLVFLFLARFFDEERWTDLAWLWFFVVIQMLANGYYAVYLTFFVSVTVTYQVLSAGKLRDPRFLAMLVLLGLGVALATGPFIYQYIAFKHEMGFERMYRSNAEISSFFSAPWFNRLYGGWLPDHPEARLFPGVTPVVLAMLGVVGALRTRGQGRESTTSGASLTNPRSWFFFFIALFVFSVWASFGTSVIGPYRLLYDHVPGFDGLRAVARIHIMTLNSLAVLAAFGVASVVAAIRRQGPRRVAAFGIPLLLLIEYFSVPVPTTRVPAKDELPSVYGWLAEEPGGGPILELPLPYRGPRKNLTEIARVYASTVHWRRILNGYSGYLPPVNREIRRRWNLVGPVQVVADAKTLGIHQILLHTQEFRGAGLKETRAALLDLDPPAVKVADIEGVEVWEIEDSGGVAAGSGVDGVRALPRSGWRASATVNTERAGLAIDGDPATSWRCETRPFGEVFTVDFGSQKRLGAIELMHGRNRKAFPRRLVVELASEEGVWRVVTERRFEWLPIEAFLRPLELPLVVEFEASTARYLRLTNAAPHQNAPWLISEIAIW
ncbi:MAG: DUF6044 family protein [Acidobacteria bacterium]|nr:DUF6044 family protein [Acidobacteriota bacterium]